MITPEDIYRFGQTHAQEAIDLLCALAPIPAPSHKEQRRISFCREWLENQGVCTAYTDVAGNLIIPFFDISSSVTVVCAHADVVFADETPLPLTVDDGRICCPGVGDDTANAVMLLMAAVYLHKRGMAPSNGGVLLVVNVGEEGLGNLKGARQLLADFGGRICRFVSFDCYATTVIDRAVGSLRYRVSCDTKGGHSYFDFGRPNAIATLSALVADWYAQPTVMHTTYNVGTITGGTSVNTIAAHAEMFCEIRSTDAAALAQAKQAFEETVRRHDLADAPLTVETVGERPCGGTVDAAAQQALCDMAKTVLTRHFGNAPSFESGSTDCNVPLSVGIPSVCFGCILGDGMHTREEYVTVDSIPKGLSAALDMITHLCDE